jgi:hypothetical protein
MLIQLATAALILFALLQRPALCLTSLAGLMAALYVS